MAQQRQAHHRTHLTRQLTPKQREVLARVAQGRTNGEIASELGISLDGVKWHVSEILSRLEVSTREDAAALWQRDQSKLARARQALSFSLFGSRQAGFLAAGTGTLVIAAVLVFVVAGRGDDLSPAQVESTQTAEADALRPAPCQGDDAWIAQHRELRGYGDVPDGPGGWSLIAETPCRILGDFTVTVFDSGGHPVKMPGNPARVFMDLDGPLPELMAPGVRALWVNRCAYSEGMYTIRISAGGTSLTVNPFRDMPPENFARTFGYRCDPSLPMSLTISEAVYDRTNHLSDALPAGTWGGNPASPPRVAAPPACNFPTFVCEAIDYGQRWIDSNGQFSPPAPLAMGNQWACGEYSQATLDLYKRFGGEPHEEILPMDHPYCDGEQLGAMIGGSPGWIPGPDGEPMDVLDNHEQPWALPVRIASVACINAVPDCMEYVLAFETGTSPAVLYFVYRPHDGGSWEPMRLAWGMTNDQAMLTGGRAMTIHGEADFVPLP